MVGDDVRKKMEERFAPEIIFYNFVKSNLLKENRKLKKHRLKNK